jgi:hypothetical protein
MLGLAMTLQQAYWRFFNFMVRRVVAVGFALVGSLIAISAIPALLDPNGTIPVNGVPEHDIFYRLFAFLLPAIIAVFGVLMYRAKPFTPPGQEP